MTAPPPRPMPLLHIRVIGPTAIVRAVLNQLTQRVNDTLGPDITCRTHTRAARRAGTIRSYLTITAREEEP